MTNEEVARAFARGYPEILEYTKKALWHFGSPLEADEVIGECYLHVWSSRGLVTPSLPVTAIAKNWIKQNLIWSKSPLKTRQCLGHPGHSGPDPSTAYQDSDLSPLLVEWKAGLAPPQRRLWELYWEQGLTKGREISLHLGISVSSAYLLIKEAKALGVQLHTHITDNI
jgi:DNA-directed RNA polymerase specialized sigma24 family protein